MKKIIYFIFILYSAFVQAEIVDTYQFKNTEDRIRAITLAKSLRCPQCQNQNLVESNSPIAYDLRIEVYKMVDENKTNQQIIDVMTSRFGNFVLYNPPFQWTTALLWGLPIILLLLSGGIMWFYLRQRTNIPKEKIKLTIEQQKALNNLLQKNNLDNIQ